MAESAPTPQRKQELARLMLTKARQDFQVVVRLAGDITIANETIGFHIQQAIEKSLKAVLIRHGLDYTFTHDLTLLFQQTQTAGVRLPGEVEEIAAFTPFAVQFRYALLEEPEDLDRQEGAALAQSYLTWAHHVVEAPTES